MTKKSRLFIALLSIGIPAFDCFSSNNVLLKFSTARVKNDDGQLTVMVSNNNGKIDLHNTYYEGGYSYIVKTEKEKLPDDFHV